MSQSSDSRRPLVSAIVLNYRSPQPAVRCVKTLLEQSPPQSVTPSGAEGQHACHGFGSAHHDTNWLEIIVVDNHSQDDSIGVLRNRVSAIANVRIIETARNTGFGAGYNLGIRHARGRYILINNPMKRLEPGALARMIAAMERDPSIGIVGPKLVHEDGTIRDSARAFPTLLDVVIKRTWLERIFTGRMRHYRQLDRDPDEARDTDWAIGGCLLVRRELLERIGAFDPRYFLFFEDIDLCRRCWDAGMRVVYLPQAQAHDRKRRLSEGGVLMLLLKPTGRAHIASALKYFWKWGGILTPPSISPTLAAHADGVPESPGTR